MSDDPKDTPAGQPRRKPRHVRAAARLLQKEARRILRKHRDRLDEGPRQAIEASVAGIDDATARGDLAALEAEAERLDELLETHAAFARKSALRETIENVSMAVVVALGLRACVYEPFQIPSGSMMPTLVPGDHIFVNKFVYGIQIPFTNMVLGADHRPVERGDVVVFRYPLDESDDYIKRVIGLPGDVVEIRGRTIYVRRKGAEEFEPIEQQPLDERCRDESGTKVVPGCKLFRERYGEHVYTVRYVRPELAPLGEFQRFEVPEGHLFVMGDNRNQSEDSRAWMVKVEAVAADRVLTVEDLRARTEEALFTLRRSTGEGGADDPDVDVVVYEADHRSSKQDVTIEVLRDPVLPLEAVFGLVPGARTFDGASELLSAVGAKTPVPPPLEAFERFALGRDENGARVLAAVHRPTRTAFVLTCGSEACPTGRRLVERASEVAAAYLHDPAAPVTTLLWDDGSIRYRTQVSTARDEAVYAVRGALAGADDTEVFLLRNPPYGMERALGMLFAAFGARRGEIPHDPALPVPGGLSWSFERDDRRVWIGVDLARRLAASFACGPTTCPDRARYEARVRSLVADLADAGTDPRRFRALAGRIGGAAGAQPEGAAYERLAARGSRKGGGYRLEVRVERHPAGGLAAAVARAVAGRPSDPAPDVAAGARRFGSDGGARTIVVPVAASDTVVRLTCSPDLCPEDATLTALAKRAAERAAAPENFVDPQALRPKPFVPRGNVKGRADRIWWPPGRFWKAVD